MTAILQKILDRSSNTHLILPLVLLGILSQGVHAQEESTSVPQGPIKTRLVVPMDTPLLVEQKAKISIEMQVSPLNGSETRNVPLNSELDARFIDEYAVLEKDREEATRTYLHSHKLMNGVKNDPPFTGAALTFVREGEETDVKVSGDRIFPSADLRDQLSTLNSIWCWIALPDELELGASFSADTTFFSPLLFGSGISFSEANAELTFDSFDPETKLAEFSGPMRVVGKDADGEFLGEFIFEGSLVLRTHVEERRMDLATFEGTARLDNGSNENFEMTANGKIHSTITARLAPDADKLMRKKPKFRNVVRHSPTFGLIITLPSCWTPIEAEEGSFAVVRTIDGDLGVPYITLDLVEDSSALPKKYLKNLASETKKNYPGSKSKKVTSPLGSGQAIIIEREVDGTPMSIRSEFYPYNGQWLVFKLYGPTPAFKKALKEFEKARKTLKKGSF